MFNVGSNQLRKSPSGVFPKIIQNVNRNFNIICGCQKGENIIHQDIKNHENDKNKTAKELLERVKQKNVKKLQSSKANEKIHHHLIKHKIDS